eukprot:CAMPEP_0175150068 /NCGR_PEP_ID=MMETSP0087-20121206/17635_1 /TAXON_ID=136419 /ORGANISM="Unknown Unknown, Strain D1" /LENGTH=491 /DNA_ID=CAMNT_0016435913 /DNA_START=37 /DNA_END=1512 /DNA_ORIENTATION=+
MADPLLDPLNRSTNEVPRDTATRPIILALVAGLGALMFGYSLGFTSSSQLSMIHDGVFTHQCEKNEYKSDQADWFASTINLGCILGALTGGYLADAIGRKLSIMVSGVPWIAGFTLIALNNSNFFLSILSRILCGIAVGICSMAVPVYIAETSPPRLRGALGSVNQFGVVMGILLVYLLGAVFPKQEDDCNKSKVFIQAWRDFAWIGVAITAAMVVFVSFVPRTPSFLVAKGKSDTALAVIKRLRGPLHDAEKELYSITSASEESTGSAVTLKDLCAPALRRPWIISIGMMFAQQLCGINAIIFSSGSIFSSAGISDPYTCALIVAAVQVVFTGVGVLLIDRAGRKILLLVAATGQTFFLTTMGVFYHLDTKHDWLAIVSLVGYIISFSCGMGAIPWILMSEVFPAKVRGKAASIATVVNWSLSFIVTELFNTLRSSLHDDGTFWLFAGVSCCSIFFIKFVLIETKGKSLEEIEQYFIQLAGGHSSGYSKI